MDNEKYIGLVKWFHDQARNANYGFIQHAKLGDLFFHERSIEKGQDLSSFRENTVVVFIAQASKRHHGKFEAIEVKYLDAENDIVFLFRHFLSILLEKSKYSDYNFIQKEVHKKITLLLDGNEDKNIKEVILDIYQEFVRNNLTPFTCVDEDFLKGLLKIGNNFFPSNYVQLADLIGQELSNDLKLKLWLEGILVTCPIIHISNIILSTTLQVKSTIFNKCTLNDKSNILFKMLYGLEKIDTEEKLKIIKDILNLSKEFATELYNQILTATLNISPDYVKLDLWLEDYHEILNFDIYKLYLITLLPIDQKRFVKKVLKFIHEEKISIKVEDFTSLNVIDYETSKLLEKIDNTNLDYSTSIILNVISELQSQTKLETKKESFEAQQRIYNIILKLIKEPIDILQITGYFDECDGRCNISVKEVTNEEGEFISRSIAYYKNENQKAKNHPICDGRKAKNTTTEPLRSEEDIEFWWCANQKCYKPSRVLHESAEWEKYTLLDFLTILKINFKESDLEIYLNIINKANRFLNHLKCRECNHILYPKGKTKYAFYGVNHFSCKTETCSEKDKIIYLSHCLNGFCEMEIDSRDCVKCKPTGQDTNECGWYVCNFCHACCNSQQLEQRKWVYENILHQEYKCHLVGHRDLGILSCNKCGEAMVELNVLNFTEYERILNWFIANKDKSERIFKSGKTQKNKWWFVLKKGNNSFESFREKLNKYYQLGFHIPDITLDKELQLISEPIDIKQHNKGILTCKNCGNTLDLNDDFEKSRAIKQYHNVKFIKETV